MIVVLEDDSPVMYPESKINSICDFSSMKDITDYEVSDRIRRDYPDDVDDGMIAASNTF